MGSLPDVPLPTGTVTVGDMDVTIRGLSRAEAMQLGRYNDDIDQAERFVLAAGVGVSEDEAQAWRETVPADVVGLVVDGILELSGLAEGASKSDSERADARDG